MDRQQAIDLILDHYHHPRHYGHVEDASFSGQGVNPGCGDVVQLSVKLDPDRIIQAVGFEGHGCTISLAAASLLTEMIMHRPLQEALSLSQTDLIDSLGEDIVINRARCVTLALDVLKSGAAQYLIE
jgi:nitrogen fixation protein NifU and related proteins